MLSTAPGTSLCFSRPHHQSQRRQRLLSFACLPRPYPQFSESIFHRFSLRRDGCKAQCEVRRGGVNRSVMVQSARREALVAWQNGDIGSKKSQSEALKGYAGHGHSENPKTKRDSRARRHEKSCDSLFRFTLSKFICGGPEQAKGVRKTSRLSF